MKRLLELLQDEAGFVLSAETALLGTVGVLGAVVGVNLFAGAVNDELRDAAYSFRSLDQSYSVAGHSSPTAWTAGSGYTQEPVEKSLAKLRDREEELRAQHERDDAADDDDRGEESGRRDDGGKDRDAERNKDRDDDRDDRKKEDRKKSEREDRDD